MASATLPSELVSVIFNAGLDCSATHFTILRHVSKSARKVAETHRREFYLAHSPLIRSDLAGPLFLPYQAKLGHKDVVEWILRHGGSVCPKTLRNACKSGNLALVADLAQGPGFPRPSLPWSRKCFLAALLSGNEKLADWILENHATLHIPLSEAAFLTVPRGGLAVFRWWETTGSRKLNSIIHPLFNKPVLVQRRRRGPRYGSHTLGRLVRLAIEAGQIPLVRYLLSTHHHHTLGFGAFAKSHIRRLVILGELGVLGLIFLRRPMDEPPFVPPATATLAELMQTPQRRLKRKHTAVGRLLDAALASNPSVFRWALANGLGAGICPRHLSKAIRYDRRDIYEYLINETKLGFDGTILFAAFKASNEALIRRLEPSLCRGGTQIAPRGVIINPSVLQAAVKGDDARLIGLAIDLILAWPPREFAEPDRADHISTAFAKAKSLCVAKALIAAAPRYGVRVETLPKRFTVGFFATDWRRLNIPQDIVPLDEEEMLPMCYSVASREDNPFVFEALLAKFPFPSVPDKRVASHPMLQSSSIDHRIMKYLLQNHPELLRNSAPLLGINNGPEYYTYRLAEAINRYDKWMVKAILQHVLTLPEKTGEPLLFPTLRPREGPPVILYERSLFPLVKVRAFDMKLAQWCRLVLNRCPPHYWQKMQTFWNTKSARTLAISHGLFDFLEQACEAGIVDREALEKHLAEHTRESALVSTRPFKAQTAVTRPP